VAYCRSAGGGGLTARVELLGELAAKQMVDL